MWIQAIDLHYGVQHRKSERAILRLLLSQNMIGKGSGALPLGFTSFQYFIFSYERCSQMILSKHYQANGFLAELDNALSISSRAADHRAP